MERVYDVKWVTKDIKEKESFRNELLKYDPDYLEGLIEPVNLFGFDDPTPAEADKLLQNSLR